MDKGKEVIVLTGTSDVHYESVQVLAERGILAFYSPLLNELQRSDEVRSWWLYFYSYDDGDGDGDSDDSVK